MGIYSRQYLTPEGPKGDALYMPKGLKAKGLLLDSYVFRCFLSVPKGLSEKEADYAPRAQRANTLWDRAF